MAEGASDELRRRQPTSARTRVSSLEGREADIARTRERLSVTLTALNGEARALLDPEIPASLAPRGSRHAADWVAVGLRTTGQLRALARTRTPGVLGIVAVVAGVGLFLFRSGIAHRLWNRKKKG